MRKIDSRFSDTFNFKNLIINGDFSVWQRHSSVDIAYLKYAFGTNPILHTDLTKFTVIGSPIYGTDYVTLNGSSGYITSDNYNESVYNNLLIRFRPHNVNTTTPQIIYKSGDTTNGFAVGFDGNGNFGFFIRSNSTLTSTTVPVSELKNNTWYLIQAVEGGIVILEEDSMRCIIDDTFVTMPAVNSTDTESIGGTNTTSPISGNSYTTFSEGFQGDISLIFVYHIHSLGIFSQGSAYYCDRFKFNGVTGNYCGSYQDYRKNGIHIVYTSRPAYEKPSFETRLEFPYKFLDKTFTLSFELSSAPFTTEISYVITSDNRKNIQEIPIKTITETETVLNKKYEITFTVTNSITGSFTNSDYFAIKFNFLSAQNNNGYIIMRYIQLEKGDKATEFEEVPYDIQLIRCMRYYETWEIHYTGYYPNPSYNYTNTVYLLTSKRAIPTIVVTRAINEANETGPVSVNFVTKNSFRIYNNDWTSSNPHYHFYGYADAEL